MAANLPGHRPPVQALHSAVASWPVPPVAALLPALDPTPHVDDRLIAAAGLPPTESARKRRDWFFGIPQHQVLDHRSNIGPTLR